MRARIIDVAAAAGVSTATVSLVLNGREHRISAQTAERVRRAAAEIGYTPNGVARGLRTQRSRMVGFVSDTIATTPFAGDMIAGAEQVAREHGYLVVLVDTGAEDEVEAQAVRVLADHQVDGLIYARMWHQVVEPATALPADTVYLDCRPVEGGRAVVPDDYAGGVAAVRELIEAGHRRVAFVDVDVARPIAAELRLAGYRDTLRAAGVTPDPAWHVSTTTDARGGREATARLLDLAPDLRPTGIFCFNDRVAVGVYQTLARRGLRVPEDVSVVGYDDQQLIATELDPPLTTVALPHEQMGRWAMEVALGVRVPHDEHAYLMPCPIVRRASVSAPPANAANDSRRRA